MHILPQCLTNGFWKFICSIEEHLGESGAWKSHFHGLGLKMRVPQTVADMRSTQDPAKHGALARRCSPKFDTGCLLQCRRVAVKTASIGNRRFSRLGLPSYFCSGCCATKIMFPLQRAAFFAAPAKSPAHTSVPGVPVLDPKLQTRKLAECGLHYRRY